MLLIPFLLYTILLIQTTLLIKLISIAGIEPDLIIIFLTYYSLSLSPTKGITLGFATGLVLDSFNPNQMGINMLIYTLYTYVFSMLNTQINKHNPQTQFAIVLLGCLGSRILYFLLTEYERLLAIFPNLFLLYLPEAIYTSLFAVLLYFLLPNFKKMLFRFLDN